MEELFKNSLMGELEKLGFDTKGNQTSSNVSSFDIIDETGVLDGVNPLAISVNEEDIKNSPFVNKALENNTAQNPINEDIKENEPAKEGLENFNDEAAQKRLNDLDLNILQDNALKKAGDEFSGGNILGRILYKYFPNIYKGYLMKKALNKLNAINKTAVELISKKIPYGESEERYDALTGYLSSANTIHAKLMKKI